MYIQTLGTLPYKFLNYLHVMGGPIALIDVALAGLRSISFLCTVNPKELSEDTPKFFFQRIHSKFILTASYEGYLQIININI